MPHPIGLSRTTTGNSSRTITTIPTITRLLR
jgi:hypothetical protein